MSPSDLFAEIIQNIDPEIIPAEFIILAKVTDNNGKDFTLSGQELAKMMQGPERQNLSQVKVIMNVQKIRNAISARMTAIYMEMDRKIAEAAESKNNDI